MNETTLKMVKSYGLPTVIALMLMALVTWMIKDGMRVAHEDSVRNTAALVAALDKLGTKIDKLDDRSGTLGDHIDAAATEVKLLQSRIESIERWQVLLSRRTARVADAVGADMTGILAAPPAPAAPGRPNG